MERLTERTKSGKLYLTPEPETDIYGDLTEKGFEQLYAIYDRLAAYEDTGLSPNEIPHWIPVGERLPKKIEYREADTRELIPLLVCVEGTEYPFRAFYDGKSWGDGWSKLDVTFWMPLPQPPREEK